MKSVTDTRTLIGLENVSVSYGVIDALRSVSLNIREAEIHAIIGEHGAGKSTFAKVLAGYQSFNIGSVRFKSSRYKQFTIASARKFGIHIVHQHNPFFKDLTVGEYFFLNNERSMPFLFNKSHYFKTIKRHLHEFNVEISPNTHIKDLKLSDRIFIDVFKQLTAKPKVLILDEALEKITTDKLTKVITLIKNLRDQGTSTIIITHRVDDILEIADRVSVFKDGRVIFTDNVSKVDRFYLIQMAYTNFKDYHSSSPDFFKFIKYNEAILQKLPVNILVIDNQFNIKIVNEKIKSFLGLPSKKLLESNVLEAFEDSPQLIKLITMSINEKKAQAFFRIKVQLNQRELVCKANTMPIIDGNLCIGSIVLLDDITEQEKLREKLMLTENLSSLGLLAAGVAHEINNPLDIINYQLEEINLQTTDQKILSSSASIREEVKIISHIIHNLIDFSGSSLTDQQDIFDLRTTIEDLINLVRYGAKKRNIRLDFHTNLSQAQFKGNKTEIRQVLLNIIRNSFEAMKDEGNLDITLLLNDKQSFYKIICRDNGSGIEEAELKNIFLPFYSTKSQNTKNSGLGLSLSYGIINRHRGRISVRNLYPGCEFVLELPYLEDF